MSKINLQAETTNSGEQKEQREKTDAVLRQIRWCAAVQQTYDMRCYFNVRSKADMSRLNLPHGRTLYTVAFDNCFNE